MIDAHLHSSARPLEDFKLMKMSGVSCVVSCAYDALRMRRSNVCLEHFDKLVYDEPKRLMTQNMKMLTAIGIHPRAIPEDYDNVINNMGRYLNESNVVAIGEIGLEVASSVEQEVFIRQLRYADENNVNVIVHTPRKNKKEITQKTIELLDENINEKLVQLDHIDNSIIDLVIDKNYTLAITVQPLKMSVDDTVELLDKYGYDKFVIDSDVSYAPSDPLSLPKLKHALELNDTKKSDVAKVLTDNAKKFHKIS